MTAQAPESPEALALQSRLGAERWAVVVAEAHARGDIFDAVAAHKSRTGQSWRGSLAVVSPRTPWPTFMHWRRRYAARSGPTWERLLDESTPPPPKPSIAEEIVRAACGLRRGDRSMTTDKAREHLGAVFGEAGEVSDAWLRRVWKTADLKHIAKSGPTTPAERAGHRAAPDKASEAEEEVEYFHGGGGLALVAAADAELKVMQALAECALRAGLARSEAQTAGLDATDDAADRDEQGKFTAEYNARRRGATPPGQADARWASDQAKAAQRPLATLQTLARQPEPLARRMLAMGASPLVLNSRGFDGLCGPTGAWLGALGGVAYMPATLDKTLTELGLLDVDEAIWREHARVWQQVSRRWCGGEKPWLRTVAYVDGTADPYWTQAFAKSGKVSRVGRVMPCLSRIAVNSGVGVPLLVETHTGVVSLKKRLLPMLAELDAAIGPEASVGRLTVVDSEAGTAGMMWAMHEQTKMNFITVIKGQVLAGARVHSEGPWQPYRERDELREVEVDVHGKEAPPEGLTFRAVEMRRGDGRHPHTTLFATNAYQDELPTAQLADYYLARWPRQEQLFRKARNGGGLNNSHGYGGGEVQHVALVAKRERGERALVSAQAKLDRATATRRDLAKALAEAAPEVRKAALAMADKQVRAAKKQSTLRQTEQAKLQSMPERIYERDTGRDSIMTCLKLTVMTLLEFVLKEYFGGLAMEWRTFIEQLVPLPITVRSSPEQCLYQFHGNPRNPALMADLALALAEINRRGLRRGNQRLVFEILPANVDGS